jgi:dihydropteroate synthase
MNIGKYKFDLDNEPVIMGILNVTPDSFSDGGKWNSIDKALAHTEQMIDDGASIIDIGGESTRPGYTLISDREEISRVVPVIEAVKARFDIAVSLDTYKTNVAREGIAAGADMINDVWGFKWGKKDMAELVARTGVAVCVMHNKDNTEYQNFVEDVLEELRESINIAHNAGVKDSQIVLDPGVGFGKDYAQNLMIINQVNRLKELGYPVLLGTSRKSVIGLTLDVDKDDRMAGTVATTVMGYDRGCSIFRVHDVKENYQALMMANAIKNIN